MDRKFNLICLLTDFGTADPYIGLMKAVIKNINPEIEILDLTHNILNYNIIHGAFILFNSYKYFPKYTIFVCVIDPEVGTNRKILLVKTQNYFFLAPDNGLLSMIIEKEKIEKIINVYNKKFFLKEISNTFHGRDIFAPVCAWISKGKNIEEFGKKLQKNEIKLIKTSEFQAQIKQNIIKGKVIFEDKFGNLITNIPEFLIIDKFGNWQRIHKKLKIKLNKKIISGISLSYTEKPKFKPLAIIGSYGYLEISVREGNASSYFSYNEKNMTVKICEVTSR